MRARTTMVWLVMAGSLCAGARASRAHRIPAPLVRARLVRELRGWDFDGTYGDWYTGHELGHTFGRKHPGFCGETHDDPAYPFVAGQLSNADDAYVGFDVGDASFGLTMTALPGTDWHDVMT